jgi:predicted CopG family antitoxin
MIEKMRMTTIWVSPDTYRKLLEVERVLVTKNNCTASPDDAVRELIEFWKKHQPQIKKMLISL